jgi:hypothetical protein
VSPDQIYDAIEQLVDGAGVGDRHQTGRLPADLVGHRGYRATAGRCNGYRPRQLGNARHRQPGSRRPTSIRHIIAMIA